MGGPKLESPPDRQFPIRTGSAAPPGNTHGHASLEVAAEAQPGSMKPGAKFAGARRCFRADPGPILGGPHARSGAPGDVSRGRLQECRRHPTFRRLPPKIGRTQRPPRRRAGGSQFDAARERESKAGLRQTPTSRGLPIRLAELLAPELEREHWPAQIEPRGGVQPAEAGEVLSTYQSAREENEIFGLVPARRVDRRDQRKVARKRDTPESHESRPRSLARWATGRRISGDRAPVAQPRDWRGPGAQTLTVARWFGLRARLHTRPKSRSREDRAPMRGLKIAALPRVTPGMGRSGKVVTLCARSQRKTPGVLHYIIHL